MFGKLLKYEFKSAGKWYLGLYAVIAVLSVAIGFWVQSLLIRGEYGTNTYVSGSETEGIFFGITMMALFLIIFALLVSTFLMIAFRFKNNVYGREGYLTMTLPVTSHQIILSKYVAAIIWYVIAGVGIALAGVIIVGLAYLPIMAQLPYDFADLIQFTREIFAYHYSWLFVLNVVISCLVDLLLVYFAISLGQLFKDHRTLLAVVFYFGISFIINIVISLLLLPLGGVPSLIFISGEAINSSYLIGSIIFEIALGFLYYSGSHYILTKKLNLQ